MIRIGTPLSASATKVLFLGAGELGKEVVVELQRLGVETIACDRYANAPAMHVAHRFHVIDMQDPLAIRAVIQLERPHYIVPEIEAIATDELVRLESENAATVIPTAQATRLTMNREGIRRLAAEDLGHRTSQYAFASSAAELQRAAAKIGFPVFIKPVMSSSGKGQSRVESASGITAAWDHALAAGRGREMRVIVEGAVEFDFEITLLTVRHAAGTDFCAPIGHRQVNGDYVESWQPQAMSEAALHDARRIAASVTDALGGFGVFGVELFVRDDEVWFSEVSPRPHDTGLVTLASQRQSEFGLHARAILGLPVDPTLTRPGASAVIYGKLDAEGVSFDGLDNALSVPETDLRLFGKPVAYQKRRMGVAMATGETVEEARARARECASRVVVVDEKST
ncbi:MAG: formate-dependent phosphoribosylglycinamide formyltransferase [Alphaproteobacteria bacterium]|nr:formate-dependent phosphoribosylglycinamide formyltransferase [Alphaproteobacteria bacterium]